jgi:hypothetical protein
VALSVGGRERVLRPTFAALVAAEGEVGSLFALLERAAAGEVRLSEMGALFWHCLDRPDGEARPAFEAELLEAGPARLLPRFRALLAAVFGAG